MDRELDAFKRIDLREYAASLGYELDRRESSRGNAVMRKDSDKIIIKKEPDGHYVYFSVRDGVDNGTIIDFIQARKNISLGELRKELRAFSGAIIRQFRPMEVTRSDLAVTQNEYNGTSLRPFSRYLVEERGIPLDALKSRRFDGRIRIDARGNAVFPHEDELEVTGLEKVNYNFKGFSAGGEKGLWLSNRFNDDAGIVFCESAIECLSYETLFAARLFPGSYRYASIAGRMSPKQETLVAR